MISYHVALFIGFNIIALIMFVIFCKDADEFRGLVNVISLIITWIIANLIYGGIYWW